MDKPVAKPFPSWCRPRAVQIKISKQFLGRGRPSALPSWSLEVPGALPKGIRKTSEEAKVWRKPRLRIPMGRKQGAELLVMLGTTLWW